MTTEYDDNPTPIAVQVAATDLAVRIEFFHAEDEDLLLQVAITPEHAYTLARRLTMAAMKVEDAA